MATDAQKTAAAAAKKAAARQHCDDVLTSIDPQFKKQLDAARKANPDVWIRLELRVDPIPENSQPMPGHVNHNTRPQVLATK